MNPIRLSISQDLFQALITHFWRARDQAVRKDLAFFPNGYLISYGELIVLAGVHIDPRNAGAYLNDIAVHCENSGLGAPLHALVVSKESMLPGKGYYDAPLSSKDEFGWMSVDVPRCMECEKVPRVAPKLLL